MLPEAFHIRLEQCQKQVWGVVACNGERRLRLSLEVPRTRLKGPARALS